MMENKSLERQWLIDRLETLSVKEQTQLAAAIISRGQLAALSEKTGEERELAVRKMDPNAAKEAVNLLLALPDYEVICPAGSYEQLGEYYLRYEAGQPNLIPYADLEQIGWNYEDSHLGIFIGDCFVILPKQEPRQFYDGTNLDRLPDTDWSLRLKLASPAVPEGACRGRAYRVGGKELSRTLHLSRTDLQELVNKLRQDKKPIASDRYGYFYADNAGEVYATIGRLRKMRDGIDAAIRGLEQSLDGFPGRG